VERRPQTALLVPLARILRQELRLALAVRKALSVTLLAAQAASPVPLARTKIRLANLPASLALLEPLTQALVLLLSTIALLALRVLSRLLVRPVAVLAELPRTQALALEVAPLAPPDPSLPAEVSPVLLTALAARLVPTTL